MKQGFALILCFLLVATSLVMMAGCGDDGGSDTDDDDNNTTNAELVLGDGSDHEVPVVMQDVSGERVIYRNEGGVFSSNGAQSVTISNDPVSYGIGESYLDANLFVYKSDSKALSRFRWNTNSADTHTADQPLAPGYCLSPDGAYLVYATQDNYWYRQSLVSFQGRDNTSHIDFAVLDPDTDEQLRIKSFACDASVALAFFVDENNRLYSITYGDPTPKVSRHLKNYSEPIYGRQLQIANGWVVWLGGDDANDIWGYSYQTGGDEPVKLAETDPAGAGIGQIEDMRAMGDVITWSDDKNGSYDIWWINLANFQDENHYYQLTTSSGNERYPYYFNQYIYWQDDRNGQWDIYRAQLTNSGKVAE